MQTVRGQVRVPTVIVAVNFARVPKKRPKLCAKTIRERDGNRCQYTGKLLKPDEGSLDHVLPRSRGGKDAWENLVWLSKAVNTKKATMKAISQETWEKIHRLGGRSFWNRVFGSHPSPPASNRCRISIPSINLTALKKSGRRPYP